MTSILQHAPSTWEQSAHSLDVTLSNGVQLQFSLAGNRLRGLSNAVIYGTSLMAEGSLRLPHFETRDGWLVQHFEVQSIDQSGEGVTVVADVFATRPPVGRRLDMFQVAYLYSPVQEPQKIGTLRWHFLPEERSIGNAAVRATAYSGFSYAYELELERPFHWLLDSGTWEIDGEPEGVTLLSQHKSPVAGPMEFTVSRTGPAYFTGETFPKPTGDRVNFSDVVRDTKNDPNDDYIIPIQAQLRGAGGAIVDVQWKGDTLLLGAIETPGYYRTLVDWRPEGIGIAQFEHHYFSLTTHFTTAKKLILAAKVESLTRLGAINLWTDAYDAIGNAWRAAANVSEVIPEPSLGLDSCGGAGVHLGYGPADMLDKWEAQFEWLRANGYKGFYLAGIGNHRGHELPGEANLCQPYDYRVHARYGGEERFRSFCQKAHHYGMWVCVWIGVPSAHAPVLKEHPDWVIRYDSGAPWDGNYVTLNSASLQRGFGDWILDEARYMKDLGVDRIYFDSYHNLWAMPVDYGDPTLRPQFDDVVKLQGDLEKLGLQTHIESVGPLGMVGIGLWPQYVEHPELCYGMQLGINVSDQVEGRPNQLRNGIVPPELYWRLAANRAPFGLGVMDLDNEPFVGDLDVPAEINVMNRIYNELLPVMKVRTLLEDGGIRWDDPETGQAVVFEAVDGVLNGRVRSLNSGESWGWVD